jgi:hypothetical protein
MADSTSVETFHVVLTFFFFTQLVIVLGMTCADGVNNFLRDRGVSRFVCGVDPLLTHIIVNLDHVCDVKGTVKCPNCEVNRHLGGRAECPMAFVWPINLRHCNSVLTLNVGCLFMVRQWPPLTDGVQRGCLQAQAYSRHRFADAWHFPCPPAPLMRPLKHAAEVRWVGATPGLLRFRLS